MRRQGLGAVALVLCDLRLVLREPCVDGVVTLYVKGGSCVGCCLVLGAVLGEGLLQCLCVCCCLSCVLAALCVCVCVCVCVGCL